jgi:hypothetical protein
MQHWPVSAHQLRPSVLLEALHHLQFAGLIASTANQPGDTLTLRRYWRIPTPARAGIQRQYGAGVDLLERR